MSEASEVQSPYQWKKFSDQPGRSYWHPADGEAEHESPQEVAADASFEEGYAAGFDKGRAAAEHQISEQLGALQALMADVEQARDAFMRNNAGTLLEALHGLFAVLFQHELRAAPGLLEALRVEAERSLEMEAPIVVQMNPSDFERLSGAVEEALGDTIQAHADVSPSSVRLASGNTMRELDLTTHLRTVLNDFLSATAERADDETEAASQAMAAPPNPDDHDVS